MIRILPGDCRDVLATLPDASVQMVCTSPPYWGLRDYGIPPSIWGGDPDCEHQWGDHISVNATNHTTKARWNHTRNGRDELQPTEKRVSWLRTEVKQGQFCQRCGAWAGALGLEPSPDLFCEHIVDVFREVWRVLRHDGVLWLNLGDSYATGGGKVGERPGGGKRGDDWPGAMTSPNRMPIAGLKPKDLVGVPWRVAFALQADGWWLRKDIIWAKPNPMPESATDRPTSSHEHVFLLAKSERYFYDAEAIREGRTSDEDAITFRGDCYVGGEINNGRIGKRGTTGNKRVKVPGGWDQGEGAHGTLHRNGRTEATYQEAELRAGRNSRDVWTIATAPFPEAHFATFPPELAERCILAGSSERGCCSACRAPWRRVVTKGEPNMAHRLASGADASGGYGGQSIKNHDAAGVQNASDVKRRILDGMREKTCTWEPSCDCGANVVPCTVLDPFSGAGTTALVADRLGRDAIGIELNGDYVAMSRRRLVGDSPLFAEVS